MRLTCAPKWVFFLSLFVAGPGQAVPGGASLSPDAVREIDRLAADALNARAMPGVSVSVVFGDGTLLSRQYGSASLQPDDPVTGRTLFRIGSISKLFTALAILKLVEEGRLDLDAPIARIFPAAPEFRNLPPSVTVRRLLNHTSGLPDFTPDEIMAKVEEGDFIAADYAAVLARPLRYEPGSQWVYSDAAFRVLSEIVEQVGGMPFGRYISERLAPALGLPSLRLCEPGAAGHASGYLSRNGRLEPERAYAIRGLLGEGGLCGTTDDLARLPSSLEGGRWVSRESIALMTAPTRLRGGELVDYGMGVRGGWLGRTRAWGHTGGGPDGSWASIVHYPERDVTVAVAANGTGAATDAATLQAAVAAVVLGDPGPETGATDASLAATLAGSYIRGERTTCIRLSDGELVRARPDADAAPTALLHQGSNVFARLDFPLDRIVFQVERDRAIAYRVYYDGLFAEYWRRAEDGGCDASGLPGE